MIDIFPTIGSTENVSDIFELHVFALVVATVENHLVGTCSAFEAVFANVHAVFGRGVEGGDLGDDEHVAAGGAEEEHCLIDLKFLFSSGGGFSCSGLFLKAIWTRWWYLFLLSLLS